MYQAPSIQLTINKLYYKKPDDDGILLEEIYGEKCPLVAMAITLAAV